MTIEEALAEALGKPEDYFGAMTELSSQGWARVFGRSRDSDNLEISNFEAILKTFNEEYESGEDFRVEYSHHWAVGWTDTLLVRALQCNCEDWEDAEFVQRAGNLWECMSCGWSGTAGIRPIFYDAFDFAQRLMDYPLLDEEDYSRREYEDVLDYIESARYHATPEEIRDDDSFEVNNEAVARYLFDIHSVIHIDDIETQWITDAIVEQYQKERS